MKLGKLLLIYILMIALLVLLLPFLGTCNISKNNDRGPIIKILDSQGLEQEIFLEEYLIGVLAAEMPASFESEALKAQAIAARTFIYRNSPQPLGDGGRHGEVSVCSDSTHCQAYKDEAARKEKWQGQAAEYENKLRDAVNATAGQVATINGQVVNTPYFAVCGGHTASSADVWGGENSWLVGVSCSWDTDAPKYRSELVVDIDEAARKLGVDEQSVRNMRIVSHYDDGRVCEVTAGNKRFNGRQIRTLLGLNSALFSWQIQEDKVIFAVRGYGHGVGLCQYGANGMAKEGYTAKQIIEHYYRGVQISQVY